MNTTPISTRPVSSDRNSTLKKGRVIIIAYRLPFKIMEKQGKEYMFQNSGGLVSAILSLTENHGIQFTDNILWIGASKDSKEKLNHLNSLPNIEILPVNLPNALETRFYGGFCNSTIWPLFHYFPFLAQFESAGYDSYAQANDFFLRPWSQ